MGVETKHFYVFGPFRINPEERVLLRDGSPVPLGPKGIETLLVLVQNAGHLVDKDDLLKRFVSALVLHCRSTKDNSQFSDLPHIGRCLLLIGNPNSVTAHE